MPKLNRRAFFAGAFAIGLVPGLAFAQWPEKPVTVLTVGSAGGVSDLLLRIVGEHFTKTTGQNLIVDNRPGGGGQVGMTAGANASPDGYSYLLSTQSTQVMAPSLFNKLEYDHKTALKPVRNLVVMPNLLYVNVDLPVTSVKELIEYGKAHPGELNFANTGPGTTTQLSSILFADLTGIEMETVSFAGSSASMQGVISGEAHAELGNVLHLVEQVKAGRIRPLAVTSKQRIPALPDVPTLVEAGGPDIEIAQWFGIVAPSAAPQESIDQFSKLLADAMADPDVTEKVRALGAEPAAWDQAEFAEKIASDEALWADVIEKAGIPKQ
jgi:tripartite-type tricarboxylate transporter receptor subunit TctC